MKGFIFFIALVFWLAASLVAQSINPPSLAVPANGAANIFVSVSLDWTSVSSNEGYIYEIDITSSFNSSLKRSSATGKNISNVTVSDLFFGQTYYWRVATKSSIDTSVWTATRSFTTINEPVLVSPSNNASNINPTINLDWALLSGAQFFLYEVDTTLNFNSVLKLSGATSTSTSNIAVSNLHFNKTYYWRIAAVNTVDTSAWSIVRSFQTIASPVLISPNNTSSNRDVELLLDWAPVTGNSGYIYQIDSTVNFNSSLLRTVSSSANISQATVGNLRFGTTYFWRVAVKTASDTSSWSNVFRFTTTDHVNLVSPPNNSTNQGLVETLDWSFISGNNGYIYEIDTVPSFNSPALQQSSFTTNTSQTTVSNLRFGTTYYWRVAAKTISDTSDWSIVFRFSTIDQVSLISPNNGSLNQNISEVLDWSAIVGNAGYIYEIDTVNTFSSPLLLQNSFTANTSQVSVNDLRFGTTYYWRVAAKAVNDTSQWSSIFSFTTRDDVFLVSPNNNATIFGVETILDWGGIPGINGYIYELDTTSNFNSLLLTSVGTSNNSSQATVSNLKYGKTYYWRVAAKSVNDTSGWSAVRSFTTRSDVTLVSPNNNFNGTSIRPTLDWNGLSGSNGYIYELDTNVSFTSPSLISTALTGITSQAVTPILRYGTKYYWRVRATTVTDTSLWSSIRNFTTTDAVPLSFPVNNALNLANNLTISWGDVTWSSYYNYEVDESPLFNSPIKIVGNTSGLTGVAARRAMLSNLAYGQDYYWRVAAVSTIDTSSWSMVRKFATSFLLPNAPAQISPLDNATNVPRRNLILDWADDTNATAYQFQLDTLNTFSSTAPIFTVNSSLVNLSRRDNFTTYYWRVRSKNTSGNSPWSTIWSFTTEDCDNSDTITVTNCGTYIFRGVFYTASGFYTRGFQNAAGCDSTLYLDITIHQPTSSSLSLTACDSLRVNGQTYFNSGNYVQTIANSKGCDSTISLDLTINQSNRQTANIVVCDSFIWAQTGLTYYNSGAYFDTLQTTTGCDSIAILNLTISSTTSSLTTIVTCDSFNWRGSTFLQSGIYHDTIQNSANCDSIVTLDLTIYQTLRSTETQDVCNQYNWNGQLLTTSGTYVDTLTSLNGCDSIVTLNLTIRDSTHKRLVLNVCDSIRINGQLITQTAIYTQVLTNSVGCDSVLSLDVTVHNSSSSLISISACKQYFWSATNRSYFSTGVYDTTFQSISGCDSTVQLNLTITNTNTSVLQSGAVLTAAQASGTYQWLNCTNGFSAIVGETGRVFTAQQSGNYAVEITNGNCIDTSLCTAVITVGLNQISDESQILIYPNPSKGVFNVNFGNQEIPRSIQVFDINGKQIMTRKNIRSQEIVVELKEASGLYFLQISSDQTTVYYRLIVQ